MIKKTIIAVLTAALLAVPAMAEDVLVLIVDSGVDYNHQKLQSNMLAEPTELNGSDGVDDNCNGYVDDLYGWNFIADSPVLVNLENTPPKYKDVLKFMDLLGKFQVGGKDALSFTQYWWLRLKTFSPKFMRWVNYTGGWAHGTHCAGISSIDSENIKIKGITHIPSGEAPKYEYARYAEQLRTLLRQQPLTQSRDADPMEELMEYFDNMAAESVAEIKAEARYMASLNPRVINCSFGSENSHLLQIFEKMMKEDLGVENPTQEQVQQLVNLFVTRVFLPRDKEFFRGVSDALVVIAAGNSSENNDELVISPNNAPIENKLIVGATYKDLVLAPFSCYGVENVDVAVPGVNIYSSYPNGKMGYMSGTSMAAPLASRYAAKVISAYPSLQPVEVKRILMGTVDKKSWLSGKVKSGGVINPERAVKAAKLMEQGISLEQAVRDARRAVSDNQPSRGTEIPVFETQEELDIYNSAIF